MNLVKTLAKVAMGVMVARGVGKMMGRKGGSGTGSTGGGLGGLGGLLGGGSTSSSQSSGAGRGIGGSDGVGGLSQGNHQSGRGFGRSPQQNQNSGGLGGLLEGLTRGLGQQQGGTQPASSGQSGGGGLADILGSVLGGKGAGGLAGGGLGGLLESLGGGRTASNPQVQRNARDQQTCDHNTQPASTGSMGELLNQAFGGQVAEPKPGQNAQAEIMLRGMLNAAKSDGKFDQAEQQKVMEHLGDVSTEELAFVRNEMAQPLDVDAFVRSVPRGLEQQVYLMSLLGIELDSQAEAQYLDRLAKGLGISQAQSNSIHQQVGVPALYG